MSYTPIAKTNGSKVRAILKDAQKIVTDYPTIKNIHLTHEQFNLLHETIREDLKPDYKYSIPWQGIEFVRTED